MNPPRKLMDPTHPQWSTSQTTWSVWSRCPMLGRGTVHHPTCMDGCIYWMIPSSIRVGGYGPYGWWLWIMTPWVHCRALPFPGHMLFGSSTEYGSFHFFPSPCPSHFLALIVGTKEMYCFFSTKTGMRIIEPWFPTSLHVGPTSSKWLIVRRGGSTRGCVGDT